MVNNKNILLNICSGKTLVGKSFIAANLAWFLVEKGYRVMIWDGDYKQSTQNFLFGVKPRYGIQDLVLGRLDIEDAVQKIAENLFLLTNLSTSNDQLQVSDDDFLKIFAKIKRTNYFDFIIFDSPTNLAKNSLQVIQNANLNLLLINDDPISVIDAYAFLKIMLELTSLNKVNLLVNNTIDEDDAKNLEQKLNSANKKFLNLELDCIGFLPYDRQARLSVITQSLFAKNDVSSELLRAFIELAGVLERKLVKTKLILQG